MGWIWLFGIVMVSVVLGCAFFGGPVKQPDGYCQDCGHAAGLDNSRFGECCSEYDDANGWASSRCYCKNAYHRNYQTTAA